MDEAERDLRNQLVERPVDEGYVDEPFAAVLDVSSRAILFASNRPLDADFGRRSAARWHALSRTAHHCVYEPASVTTELMAWCSGVLNFTRKLV